MNTQGARNALFTAFLIIAIASMLIVAHVRIFIPMANESREGAALPEPTVQIQEVSAQELPDPCDLEDVVCENEKPRREQLETMIRTMAREYGYPEERAISMAWCESTMNEFAANPKSSAKGLYQFTDTTWAYIKAEGHQFDVEENIKQFLIWDQIHPNWWICE